jgi:ABC-type multidrug transport system permease subunit
LTAATRESISRTEPQSERARGEPRPGRALLAILLRDYLVTRSYRGALTTDFAFGAVNILIYYFISQTFEGAATADLSGAPSYFDFAAVGLVVTMVVTAAATGMARRMREEQLTGTLELLAAQPVRTWELFAGLGALPFLLAGVRAVIYLLLAALLLDLETSQASWLGLAAILLATGAAMSALGMVAGSVVLVAKRGEIVIAALLTAMGLVGGAFFPIEVLPSWLQPVGEIVPTRFAYDGLRAALFRGGDWEGDALVLLAFAAVCLPAAVWLGGRALDFTRRRGSLSQY